MSMPLFGGAFSRDLFLYCLYRQTLNMDNYDYTVTESRFGLFTSVLTDGTKMVTAATEEACRFCTDNIHIPCLKGEFTGWTSEPRSATVGGKL